MAWLRIKKASEYAGVSVNTFRAWIDSGYITPSRVGSCVLIEDAEIDRFLRERRLDVSKIDVTVQNIMKKLG